MDGASAPFLFSSAMAIFGHTKFFEMEAQNRDTTPTPKLPASVRLSDGRIATVEHFQAFHFVESAMAAAKRGIKSEDAAFLQMISDTTVIDGHRLKTADIDDLYDHDLQKIKELYDTEIRNTKTDGDSTTGTLPSGKACTYRWPKVRDTKEAAMVPEKRLYRLIEACCTVDGDRITSQDVEIMDGLDFIALTYALNMPTVSPG